MIFNSYAIVQIRSFSSENIINRLKENKIEVIEFCKTEEYTFTLKLNPKNLKKVKKTFKDCKIIKKHGIFFAIKNQLVKKISLISMIIGIGFFCYLNTLIYKIEIKGNNLSINNNIMMILKENGIAHFKKKPTNEKLDNIKAMILLNLTDIENIDIKIVGTTIDLTYYLKEKQTIIQEIDGKYYASKDGIVSYVDVKRGNCLIKHNDYIKKGDLLIDDHITLEDKSIYIGGYGKIYAYTWTLFEMKIEHYSLSEADSFSYLIDKAHYQVSKNFTDKEYIVDENVLNYYYDQTYAEIKVHFTTLENLAILL